jgi:hypothetical protein
MTSLHGVKKLASRTSRNLLEILSSSPDRRKDDLDKGYPWFYSVSNCKYRNIIFKYVMVTSSFLRFSIFSHPFISYDTVNIFCIYEIFKVFINGTQDHHHPSIQKIADGNQEAGSSYCSSRLYDMMIDELEEI